MIVPGSHGHHGQVVALRVALEGETDIDGYNLMKRMEAHAKGKALKLQKLIVGIAQTVIKHELRSSEFDACIVSF